MTEPKTIVDNKEETVVCYGESIYQCYYCPQKNKDGSPCSRWYKYHDNSIERLINNEGIE